VDALTSADQDGNTARGVIGRMEVRYDSVDEALGRETLTGTVTR
jgi:hypothetical protein